MNTNNNALVEKVNNMAPKPAKKVAVKKVVASPKTSVKPKPSTKSSAAGLKKDDTAIPSKIGEMKYLYEKVTGNTMNKYGLPDTFGEERAAKKLDKIGLKMGIGDYADVGRYLYEIEKNNAKTKSAITKKRVTASRAADKINNASRKTITKKKAK